MKSNSSLVIGNEFSSFSTYIDNVVECINNNKNNSLRCLSNSVDQKTNKVIIELIRTDFSRFSNVKESLKKIILNSIQNNNVRDIEDSEKKLVGV